MHGLDNFKKHTVHIQSALLHDDVAYFLLPRVLIVKVNIFETLLVTSTSALISFFTSSFPQIPPKFGITSFSSISFAINIKKKFNFWERGYGNIMHETGSIS
jgi:hypothetical protein